MPERAAVTVRDVSKVYRLYSSLADQGLDVLGLAWLRFWRKPQYAQHPALDGVSLSIKRGERVGIVGRNGAGKTTLLKLITGNFEPSRGSVEVDGRVQALLTVGLGFHPDFTGYQNVRSSLAYSGVSGQALEQAVQDVVDFAELGEYLHQPLKTYSLGMQARLMFAASTAVRPDILIVDEILGAGDAYFSAKSAHRMEGLAGSGCTLLLVSHSMQQILQFCERAIWLETGKVVMDGDALAVVKAYEEYSQRLEAESSRADPASGSILANAQLRERLLGQVFRNSGGVSRWAGEPGVKIQAVQVVDASAQPAAVVRRGSPMRIEMRIVAEENGVFPCSFVIVLFTRDGRVLSRHCSARRTLSMSKGEARAVSLVYDPLLLGAGTYFFSAAVYRELDLRNLGAARPYDLLSRSFEFRVLDPLADDPSVFHHPARWSSADIEALEELR